MAARKPVQEFIPSDDMERSSQILAARGMPDTPPLEVDRTEYEETEDEILANVIADLGGPGIDAKVNVYQLDQNRNKAFVRAYLPTEFSLESIQSEYGPGDYEIHVRKDGRLATRKVVKIAAPKNPQGQALNVPQQNNALDNSRVLETMQNGFKELGGMFAASLAALAANQPKPKTTMEMLQEMQMMRELMGVNQPAQPQQDPMKILEIATSLAEKISPRVGEPGSGEIIMEAIKNFGPMLMNGMQNAQHSAPPAMQLPPTIIQNPITPQIPVSNPEGDEMNIMKKYYLNLLIAQAKNENDPMTYANMLLDVVGEEQAVKLVNAENWFETLCNEEPRAASFKPWFEELRACVIDLTKPETPDTTDDITMPGAPDNVLSTPTLNG